MIFDDGGEQIQLKKKSATERKKIQKKVELGILYLYSISLGGDQGVMEGKMGIFKRLRTLLS